MDAVGQHRALLAELAEVSRVEFIDTLDQISVWLGALREAADQAEPDIGVVTYSSIELSAARAKHEEVARRWHLTRQALDTFAPIEAAFVSRQPSKPERDLVRVAPVDRATRLGELGAEMVEAADQTAFGFSVFAAALGDLVRPADGSPPWTADATEAARLLVVANEASATLINKLQEYDQVIACAGSA